MGLNINSEQYNKLKKARELLPDHLLDTFKNNIITLRKYYPEIADKFDSYTPEKSIDFFCESTGEPNIKIEGEQESFYPQNCKKKYLNYLKDKLTSPNNLLDAIDSPLDFSNYIVNEIVNRKVVSLFSKKEFDPHGQIHHRYMNKITELLNNKLNNKSFCKIGEAEDGILLFVNIGVGLGYHLNALQKKIKIRNTIIIEPDEDIFFASLHTFNWSDYISDYLSNGNTLTIILDKDPEFIAKKFYRFFIQQGICNMGGLCVYDLYTNNQTNNIVEYLEKYYVLLSSAYGYLDDRAFGISHTCYSIVNKRNFVLANDMKKQYRDYPVFIIGSGPSLDQDLPFIKKYQDKAIIIACGTALDSLYHAGVMPDFYANTERTPQVKQALEVIPDKEFLKEITLLCSSVCHPSVIDFFPKTAIFGKWDENFTEYLISNLESELGFKEIQTIKNMNPLVGNMGISAATTLGFNKLYLFGIDNGKEINATKMHSKYTSLYNNSGANDTGGNYRIEDIVEGNFGGQCQTNDLYKRSILNIEAAIFNRSDEEEFQCINCSNGAKINNTIAKHSYELEEEFDKYSKLPKKEFFSYFNTEKTKNFNITQEQLKAHIHPEIMDRIYDHIIDMMKHCPKNRKDYIQLVYDINEFLKTIRNTLSTFYSRTAESSLNNMLVEFTTALFAEDQDEGKKVADEILYVIMDFLTEAKELFAKLPDYCLGDHKKYYPDGKLGRDMPHCKAPDFPPLLNIIGKAYDDPIKKFVKKYE